jgi:hypothetical protein
LKQTIVLKTFILAAFFIVFLLQSCATTPTSARRLEGSEFIKNLPGLWEGNWRWAGRSGKRSINIIRIDGNEVDLTGFTSGGDYWAATDDVYGRIENSALLLTWPLAGPNGVTDRYTMIKDDSNNLVLDGIWQSTNSSGTSQLKKIE